MRLRLRTYPAYKSLSTKTLTYGLNIVVKLGTGSYFCIWSVIDCFILLDHSHLPVRSDLSSNLTSKANNIATNQSL